MKTNFTKTFIVVCFFLAALSFQTKAQVQVFGMGGYQFNSNVTVAEGELSFDDALSYGFGFDIGFGRILQAEISWSMSATEAELERYKGGQLSLGDVYIHHFQAGVLVEPSPRKKASPFGLFSMGATLFYPTESTYEEIVNFSIALGGGVKVNVSDNVGLRFQARLLVPMQFAGTSVWFGTGGAGVSVGAWTPLVEFDLSGGLFIRL